MDYRQKSEEFRVSIRRKNLSEKMAAMRAKQTEAYSTLENPQAMVERIKGWLGSSLELYAHIGEVKLASQDPQVMLLLKGNF
jgi:hypothetical protein